MIRVYRLFTQDNRSWFYEVVFPAIFLEEKGLINQPSDIRSIKLEENEFATLIPADTLEYRRCFDNKTFE